MVSFLWNRLYVWMGLAVVASLWIASGTALALDPNELGRLLAPDGESGDHFGFAVRVDGNTALIGAPDDVDENGRQIGSAYVFVRSGMVWAFEARLAPDLARDGARFGSSVSLDGNTALVGAPGFESAFVFVRNGTVWTQEGALRATEDTVEFGDTVALDGDSAVVGALFSDAAYVFARAGTLWAQQAKLVVPDDVDDPGLFGSPVSLRGNTALVGARFNRGNGQGSGAAYVFVRSGSSWSVERKLFAEDGALNDQFGAALDLDGSTALIGAPVNAAGGVVDSGAAYVFVRSGTAWSLQAKLAATDAAPGDALGESAALSGGLALVGAGLSDAQGEDSGAAYVFVRSGLTWSQGAKLGGSQAGAQDWFSASVSIDGGTALVGAPDDGSNGRAGSAYLYSLGQVDMPPPPPTVRALFFSPRCTLRAKGLLVEREDIVRLDPLTGKYALYFDGSDVGLAHNNIDGFDLADDGSLLLSLSNTVTLPGAGVVRDGDVVRFTPTSTGAETRGTFSRFFVGAEHGLGSAGIDAVSLYGGFSFSPNRTVFVGGLEIRDEDIAQFDPATGTYRMLFDGSDVGLRYQKVDAFHVQSDGSFLISFALFGLLPGVGLVEDEDVVRFVPTSIGPVTAGRFERFFDGDRSGLRGLGTDIDALALH